MCKGDATRNASPGAAIQCPPTLQPYVVAYQPLHAAPASQAAARHDTTRPVTREGRALSHALSAFIHSLTGFTARDTASWRDTPCQCPTVVARASTRRRDDRCDGTLLSSLVSHDTARDARLTAQRPAVGSLFAARCVCIDHHGDHRAARWPLRHIFAFCDSTQKRITPRMIWR